MNIIKNISNNPNQTAVNTLTHRILLYSDQNSLSTLKHKLHSEKILEDESKLEKTLWKEEIGHLDFYYNSDKGYVLIEHEGDIYQFFFKFPTGWSARFRKTILEMSCGYWDIYIQKISASRTLQSC